MNKKSDVSNVVTNQAPQDCEIDWPPNNCAICGVEITWAELCGDCAKGNDTYDKPKGYSNELKYEQFLLGIEENNQ